MSDALAGGGVTSKLISMRFVDEGLVLSFTFFLSVRSEVRTVCLTDLWSWSGTI